MARDSAGLILYRRGDRGFEVLLVHPGGPFWARRDLGAWSIPKGEIEREAGASRTGAAGGHDGGDPALATAIREFEEETGMAPHGPYLPLSPIRQKGGKRVFAWAFAGDCDPATIRSNTFEMEWPPRSGERRSFPEVDRAAFYTVEEAQQKINPAQAALINELAAVLEREAHGRS